MKSVQLPQVGIFTSRGARLKPRDEIGCERSNKKPTIIIVVKETNKNPADEILPQKSTCFQLQFLKSDPAPEPVDLILEEKKLCMLFTKWFAITVSKKAKFAYPILHMLEQQ